MKKNFAIIILFIAALTSINALSYVVKLQSNTPKTVSLNLSFSDSTVCPSKSIEVREWNQKVDTGTCCVRSYTGSMIAGPKGSTNIKQVAVFFRNPICKDMTLGFTDSAKGLTSITDQEDSRFDLEAR